VASLVIVVSAVLVLRADRHTHRQTDADERFTPATLIDVSKYYKTKKTRTLSFFDFGVQVLSYAGD